MITNKKILSGNDKIDDFSVHLINLNRGSVSQTFLLKLINDHVNKLGLKGENKEKVISLFASCIGVKVNLPSKKSFLTNQDVIKIKKEIASSLKLISEQQYSLSAQPEIYGSIWDNLKKYESSGYTGHLTDLNNNLLIEIKNTENNEIKLALGKIFLYMNYHKYIESPLFILFRNLESSLGTDDYKNVIDEVREMFNPAEASGANSAVTLPTEELYIPLVAATPN